MPAPIAQGWTKATRELFLEALSLGFSIGHSAAKAGISRSRVYQLRKEDEEFARDWDEAEEKGSDYIEDEARRRAVEGVTKPVFYQGDVCGYVQEYSDTLLIQILKARRPDKYRENVNHNHSGSISVNRIHFGRVIEGEAEEVKAVEAPE